MIYVYIIGPIQEGEIEEAIERLKNHKSPGPDGLPAEVSK